MKTFKLPDADTKFKLTIAAEEWLDALESNEYTQCLGTLHDGVGYCCLGVGTQLWINKHGGEWVNRNDENGMGPYKYYFHDKVADLPNAVMNELGLRNSLGHPNDRADILGFKPLSSLNDHQKWSFKEIAAHLRKHPEHYFNKVEGD